MAQMKSSPGKEAPEGWLVTGYPWYAIETAAHKKFLKAYRARWKDYPRIGSSVGYNAMLAIAAMLKKAGSTERMVSYIFMPPQSRLIPQPCPAVSPDQTKRMFCLAAGGVQREPA